MILSTLSRVSSVKCSSLLTDLLETPAKAIDRSALEGMGEKSGKVYGYRNLNDDLLGQEETC